MLNHTFTWNGHSSDEFGIKIERFRALNRSARKYDSASVPGRNGNIYSLQKAWEENVVSYQIWAGNREAGNNDLAELWTNIMEWLNSADGYAELSDTYDTAHYREGVFVEATDIDNSWNRFGRAVVTFRCRPERFLTDDYVELNLEDTEEIGSVNTDNTRLRQMPNSTTIIRMLSKGTIFEILSTTQVDGITWYEAKLMDGTIGWCASYNVDIVNAVVFTNPTNRIAKPMIYMASSSSALVCSIEINEVVLYVSEPLGTIVINCENENVYNIYQSIQSSINQKVSLLTTEGSATANFLQLRKGKNFIVVDGIQSVTMNTRIWEI